MGIYKQGLNRKQQLMFPPSLDELVEEDNVVTRFSKNQFIYNHKENCYICPNNQILENSHTQYKRNNRMLDVYRLSSTICKTCSLKSSCLSDKTNYKQMYRWEHESIIDTYTTRMNTKKAK